MIMIMIMIIFIGKIYIYIMYILHKPKPIYKIIIMIFSGKTISRLELIILKLIAMSA